MQRLLTRRRFLAVLGAGSGALVTGCGTADKGANAAGRVDASEAPTSSRLFVPTVTPIAPAAATTTATPTPTPRPEGLQTLALMAGSAWETPAWIRSSGKAGPTLLVLGGVHGNEPGGWMAAEEIATWTPVAGVLAVIPRANPRAIAGFLRLVEGEGDLNRSYPGDPASEVPMSRMAAEITALAADLRPDLLFDLHESWAHFTDREASGITAGQPGGTAFLGQTITGGEGPRGASIAGLLVDRVNPTLTDTSELFFARDGSAFRRNDSQTAENSRGRSSLSLGGHVPGVTPVLVEMAQQGQSLDRRIELHLTVVRAAIDLLSG